MWLRRGRGRSWAGPRSDARRGHAPRADGRTGRRVSLHTGSVRMFRPSACTSTRGVPDPGDAHRRRRPPAPAASARRHRDLPGAISAGSGRRTPACRSSLLPRAAEMSSASPSGLKKRARRNGWRRARDNRCDRGRRARPSRPRHSATRPRARRRGRSGRGASPAMSLRAGTCQDA